MINHSNLVEWDKKVDKQLVRLPEHIREKFYSWVEHVRLMGLRDARRSPGFHDEPLKGDRLGQRSIRLNRAYRAIYIENDLGRLRCVKVIEVNKHEY